MVIRRGALAAAVAALAACWAPSAGAQTGTGGTAPAYPGNTLALEQIAPIVAGTTTKVRLSGHAQWKEPTDDLTVPYTLSIYVQNADVDPRCEPSKGAQLQKAINVATLGASETITDFVLDDASASTRRRPTRASTGRSTRCPSSSARGCRTRCCAATSATSPTTSPGTSCR